MGQGAERGTRGVSSGSVGLREPLQDRGRLPEHGALVRVLGPENLLVMKAVAHREHSPRHWFDALALVANGQLVWEVVAEVGWIRPRRVLSRLLYATSVDLHVPPQVIDRLYAATGAGAGADG